MITTTFHKCHEAGACTDSYKKMSRALGGIKEYGRDTETPVLKVLDVLGLDDALWVLGRACDDEGRKMLRLFCSDVAARVLPLFEKERPTDDRPRDAIKAARAYAWGRIDDAARAAAWDAAWDAASDAAWAAQLNIVRKYLEAK